MVPSDSDLALRQRVGRYLDGLEPLDPLVPLLAAAWSDWLERSTATVPPTAPGFLPEPTTKVQRSRFQSLLDAMVDHLHAESGIRLEHLPISDDGAA